jgi:hypothetical protein
MESDFPQPIDDSLPFEKPVRQEIEIEEEQYQPQYYQHQWIPPPPPVQKKDIFSELDRIHWIIFVAAILLAFFIGKSMSTPVILRTNL